MCRFLWPSRRGTPSPTHSASSISYLSGASSRQRNMWSRNLNFISDRGPASFSMRVAGGPSGTLAEPENGPRTKKPGTPSWYSGHPWEGDIRLLCLGSELRTGFGGEHFSWIRKKSGCTPTRPATSLTQETRVRSPGVQARRRLGRQAKLPSQITALAGYSKVS